MNYKQINQAVMAEAKEYIARGENCDNAPMYIKIKNIFERNNSPSHWKEPFTAVVINEEDREWLKAAIVWFHGCEPLVDKNPVAESWWVSSVGYAC
jgi:hypothetical protein